MSRKNPYKKKTPKLWDELNRLDAKPEIEKSDRWLETGDESHYYTCCHKQCVNQARLKVKGHYFCRRCVASAYKRYSCAWRCKELCKCGKKKHCHRKGVIKVGKKKYCNVHYEYWLQKEREKLAEREYLKAKYQFGL